MKHTLDGIVENIFEQMNGYIKRGKDHLCYIEDPNDACRVAGHYGETHFCAALLLHADRTGKKDYWEKGIQLLDSILAKWEIDQKSTEYHADFNRFAMAVVYRLLRRLEFNEKAECIMERLWNSADGENRTINWLPMRAYVNLVLYEYSQNKCYLKAAKKLLNKVVRASCQDGLFDDFIPRGESFNLQYCIATAAVTLFLYNEFPAFQRELPFIDLRKTASVLYGLVCPDGDINYMGRGANQIFAWGPWFYLTKTFDCTEIRQLSMIYIEERLPEVCYNRNIMLNRYCGSERRMWSDYHHYSVYMAHFLLWSELASAHRSEAVKVKPSMPNDSGFFVFRTKDFFCVTFTGRKRYLTEKGPAIVVIWSGEKGVIFKCGHGPSNGMFSCRRFNPLSAYMNHFGFVQIQERPRRIHNRFLRKMYLGISGRDFSIRLIPRFSQADISVKQNKLCIILDSKNKENLSFCVPCCLNQADNIEIFVDNKKIETYYIGSLPSQYGDMRLYLTNPVRGYQWKVLIS